MNNPYDDTYLKENVFIKSELQEIREFQNKQMPLMLTELLQYLNSFNLVNFKYVFFYMSILSIEISVLFQ